MASSKNKELMTVSLPKAIELYLSPPEAEGKSPGYIDWLDTRLRFFSDYIKGVHSDDFNLGDLTVEDGREYIRHLMERDSRYKDHPMHKETRGKLKVQYIHGLGRAIRSFSTWAYEEGFLDENVMRRLKLPQLPKTYPEPLAEEEIERVLAASLDTSLERLRNFSMMMLFLDTGIRFDELVNLKISRIDFTIGETTIFAKGSKERKVPIGTLTKKSLLDYITRERPDPTNPQNEDRVFLFADGFPVIHDSVEKFFNGSRKRPKFLSFILMSAAIISPLVNGGDAFSLQKILRHTSLGMTRKYVYLVSSNRKHAIIKAFIDSATKSVRGVA